MIRRARDFDLGRDKTRIKDPRDARRQERTVDALLARLFAARERDRFEIQVLADEVGMGKTFVALAVAYSVLAHMQRCGGARGDLRNCYRRVLVITPNNRALFRKWEREVSEFVRRCVRPGRGRDLCFEPCAIDRVDGLVKEIRRPGRRPQVIIVPMSLFAGGKLLDYDVKRRFLLGVLFRFWGNRFDLEARMRLLKGAPEDWPRDPSRLFDEIFEEDKEDGIPFSEAEAIGLLRRADDTMGRRVDGLLELCRDVGAPFRRNREIEFEGIERALIGIYRGLVFESIRKAFPLLVVDEAHNWKNGPSSGANGFREFAESMAPRVRRALLLTATPFQLRPEEMLEILKVGDHISPHPKRREALARTKQLCSYREKTIGPVLEQSERHSREFSKAWAALPSGTETSRLQEEWDKEKLRLARSRLRGFAKQDGLIVRHEGEMGRIIDRALEGGDPGIGKFLRQALLLYAYNADLSRELGRLVVRHRRQTEHRCFRVGDEFVGGVTPGGGTRPDGHVLHAAPGIDVRGQEELPLFVLMRCVSEMKGGRGRLSLGSDLTGCYSTLLASAEGHKVRDALRHSADGRRYLSLLRAMVGQERDERHPKFSAAVERIRELWARGEKVVVFCFRVNTARRLRDVAAEAIRKELESRRGKCLDGKKQLLALRRRLTGREQDLVALGLDRLLWSVAWMDPDCGLKPDTFRVRDDELAVLAGLSRRYGVDLLGDRVDSVFVFRAIEHIVANRRPRLRRNRTEIEVLLDRMRDVGWISGPYGLYHRLDFDEMGSGRAAVDERGAHRNYWLRETIDDEITLERLAARLKAQRDTAKKRGQIPRIDRYAMAPSLWFGKKPLEEWKKSTRGQETGLPRIHRSLWELTWTDGLERGGEPDLEGRLLAMKALRQACFRESVLVRLLPDKVRLKDEEWGELLADCFFKNLSGQQESMASKIAAFLEDLHGASGDIGDPSSARGAFYEATRLRNQQLVALVTGRAGGGQGETRDRQFTGFNTPLLPEVLICTRVGQEGIDLHRHCRHVIHYDLAWNPAVMEQRTGRTDRIGSKAFRERENGGAGIFLEIGVPFLAGTYDERMYEELRLRAQTFEALTGGEFAADHAEGQDDDWGAEGRELGLTVVPLPRRMLDDLRVRLHVYDDGEIEDR